MGKKRLNKLSDGTKWSSDYSFIFNDYNWINKTNEKDFVLHSLLVSAPFLKLADDLEVFAELNGYKDLGFDLLVQREYDNERIDLDIVKNFLNVKGKLHFFPPITVALIPQSYGDHNEKLRTEIEFIEPNEDDFGKIVFKVGDDFLKESILWEEDLLDDIKQKISKDEESYPFLEHKNGILRWDKAIFNAVIIDGQHRYLSLKKYIENYQLNPRYCQIPLNFITLIPKPGKEIELSALVETARELFIDINKNAQKVSEPRQILLDDRDLKMYISRTSIRQFNKLNADNFYNWKDSKIGNSKYLERIPQEVVSWNLELTSNDNENSSKLANNQITSTTLIYRIFKEFIFASNNTENLFDTFNRVLELKNFAPQTSEEKDVFEKIKSKKDVYLAELNEIKEEWKSKEEAHYEIYDKKEYPFNSEPFERKLYSLDNKVFDFDKDVNEWLSKWFFDESVYGKFITRFYTSFKPFQDLLMVIEPIFLKEKLQDNKDIIDLLIDPKIKNSYFDNLNCITDENKPLFKEKWEILETFKNQNTEIRNIVFQKAILSNLSHLFKVLEELDPNAADWDERIDKYINALNILYENGVFKRKDVQIDCSQSRFLENVSMGNYALPSIRLWDGIWNDINGGILYKDSDAPKIGHYIILLACSIYDRDKSFIDLNKNNLSKSVIKVRDSLRTFYLNKVRIDREYSTQQDVWNKVFTHVDNKEELNRECINLISNSIDQIRSQVANEE